MNYERGDLLKLSEEGLNHIYKYNPTGRERASQWRFEYRCRARKDADCLSVVKVGKRGNQIYHKSFLEKVT